MGLIKSSRDPRLILIPKQVTEAVNNTAVLQDDDELTYTLADDSIYDWDLWLMILSSATADMRICMQVPAGVTNTIYFDADNNLRTYGTNHFISCTGSEQVYYCRGHLKVVGAGGTFKLQWAQQVAEASNTTVYAGSNLTLRKLV